MYRLDDKSSAIKEIQKFLHYLADGRYEQIPSIGIDGVFGEETENAVKKYQEIKGMDVTGSVDEKTFISLYEEYAALLAIQEAECLLLDYTLFPFKYGDRGKSVLLINLFLDELGEAYEDLYRVRINDFYSRDTEGAVSKLRDLYMMPSTEEALDLILFKRILNDLKSNAE